MHKRFSFWMVAAALVAMTLPASAHHGWAGQGDEEFQLSGTLAAPVSLAGPHGTMKVKDQAGQVWDITLAPGARVERSGLKEGVIPVGAQVTIQGHRNRDANRFEVKTERVIYNGKTFNVYPDRK
jgi:Family of unknown function (DUF6152)